MTTYRDHTISIIKGRYEYSVHTSSAAHGSYPVQYVSVAYDAEYAETVGRVFVDSVIRAEGR